MALSFGDTYSDTPQVPASTVSTCSSSTCTGLTAPGGSTTTATVGYVDYVTEGSGTGAAVYSTQQTNSSYMRQWSIVLTNANLKTITVKVTALGKIDVAAAPTTTLSSQKANF